MRGLVVLIVMLAVAPLPTAPGRADDYPVRPIRIVVPNPPGGPTDVVARLVGPRLTERLGQPIVIDNRAGADGVIGSDQVAKAAPDGYTLLLTSSSHVMHPAVYTTMPFDTEASFAPITLVVRAPFVLVVHPALDVHTVAELIAEARRRPGQLDYGSAGNGGAVHLTMELFKTAAGIDLTHLPYKGGGPMLTELMAGQIHAAMLPIHTVVPFVREGRVRALGVTGAERAAVLPDVPTVAETLPGFESTTWYGLLAPAGTSPVIVARLNATLAAILAEPETAERFTALGGTPAIDAPAAFGALIHSEIARWDALARKANVHLD